MFSTKHIFGFWARVGIDTKFLNLSHRFISMDGWPGDATFFLRGPTFEDYLQVFRQKESSPSASSNHFFWLTKLNRYGYSFLLEKNISFVF